MAVGLETPRSSASPKGMGKSSPSCNSVNPPQAARTCEPSTVSRSAPQLFSWTSARLPSLALITVTSFWKPPSETQMWLPSNASAPGWTRLYAPPEMLRIRDPVAALSSVIELPPELATQMLVPSNASADGELRSSAAADTTCTRVPSLALISVTELPPVLATQR